MSKQEERERKTKIQHWKVIAFYLIVYDIIAVNFSYFLGLWLRFDLQYSNIPREYLSAFLKFAPVYTVAVVIVFYILRLYNSLWRFASFNELNRIFAASVITTVIQIVGITALFVRMPFSYYVVGAATQFALITVVRFAYRFINMERARREQSARSRHNVMVIGAGAAGQTILRELQNSKEVSGKACCVIDDNPNKWNRYMDGVPVVGGRDSIMEMAKKYKIDEIFFAIPTASIEDKRDILNICKETGCDMKSLPGLYQLANGDVSLSKLKPVAVEDLLGRDPIKVNMDEIFSQLKGKVIMVTGGGGSIGSELCRQIAAHDPKELIIFDVYENNAYDIQQELKKKYQAGVVSVNCEQLRKEDVSRIMEKLLYEFPIVQMEFYVPKWVEMLPADHYLKENLLGSIQELMSHMKYVKDASKDHFAVASEYIRNMIPEKTDLSSGRICVRVEMDETWYYEILSEMTGVDISDEYELIHTMQELAKMKEEYVKVKGAISSVRGKGYGVVTPDKEEIKLEEPVVIKQGSKYGVKIKSISPSIHMIRANIETEIAPIVGSEEQAKDLISYIKASDERKESIWQTNIFGKSIGQLVEDGIHTKLVQIGDESQVKLQDTMQKIVNDSKGGLVCIII